jgi:serine/threonine-protein kinase
VEQLPIAPQEFRTVRRSPDGTRLALSAVGRERGIWLYDFARGTLSRLTQAARSAVPIWTPDGERITYSAAANGPDGLYSVRSDGGGASELLFTSPRNLVAGTWTPDGRTLLYYAIPGDATTAAEVGITMLAQGRDDKSARAVSSINRAGGIDISPDGRWVAYQSPESGQQEVYVDAYPGPGPHFQVSTNGGGSPVWRADGRELFYAEPARQIGQQQPGPVDVRMMAVAVTTQPTMIFGTPRPLFSGRFSMNAPARGYDVTGDGQRFYLLQERERADDVVRGVTVVQNWFSELR